MKTTHRDQVDALLADLDALDFDEVAQLIETRRRTLVRDIVWAQHAADTLGRLLQLALEAEREFGAVPAETRTPVQAAYLEIARRFRALLDDFAAFEVGGVRVGHKLVRRVVGAANATAVRVPE